MCALIVVPEPAVCGSGLSAARTSAGPSGPVLACRVLSEWQLAFGPLPTNPVPS